MNECPICGQRTADRDCLGDHIMRTHWDVPLGDPPRKMENAYFKRHGFTGFFCWCGDGVALVAGETGIDGFLNHCDAKGGIDAHLLELMLRINES